MKNKKRETKNKKQKTKELDCYFRPKVTYLLRTEA